MPCLQVADNKINWEKPIKEFEIFLFHIYAEIND